MNKSNLKVVPEKNKYSVRDIVFQIKNNTWPKVEKFNIMMFLNEMIPGKFILNEKMIEQSRETLINYDFINKNVNIATNTKDYSNLKPGTIVFFPEKFVYKVEVVAEDNTHKIVDGHHGTLISAGLNKFEKNYNIINFKNDLDSDYLKLRNLGNLLNQTDSDSQSNTDGDLQNEWYLIMDDRESKGLESTPTQKESEKFLKDYPQITQQTLSNWTAYHATTGGRRKPIKTYSKPELDQQKVAYEHDLQYQDYTVLAPTTMKSWNGEVLGRMLNETTAQGSKQALIILYASTITQAEQLEEGSIKNVIKDGYENIRKQISYKTIEVIFLRTK